MKEPNPSLEPKKSQAQENSNFEVETIPAIDGLKYKIYFETEEAARKAIEAFWNTREESEMIVTGIQYGSLKPTQDQITWGDRTFAMGTTSAELKNHPGKLFVVYFNGNTKALKPRGVDALRKLGFID